MSQFFGAESEFEKLYYGGQATPIITFLSDYNINTDIDDRATQHIVKGTFTDSGGDFALAKTYLTENSNLPVSYLLCNYIVSKTAFQNPIGQFPLQDNLLTALCLSPLPSLVGFAKYAVLFNCPDRRRFQQLLNENKSNKCVCGLGILYNLLALDKRDPIESLYQTIVQAWVQEDPVNPITTKTGSNTTSQQLDPIVDVRYDYLLPHLNRSLPTWVLNSYWEALGMGVRDFMATYEKYIRLHTAAVPPSSDELQEFYNYIDSKLPKAFSDYQYSKIRISFLAPFEPFDQVVVSGTNLAQQIASQWDQKSSNVIYLFRSSQTPWFMATTSPPPVYCPGWLTLLFMISNPACYVIKVIDSVNAVETELIISHDTTNNTEEKNDIVVSSNGNNNSSNWLIIGTTVLIMGVIVSMPFFFKKKKGT